MGLNATAMIEGDETGAEQCMVQLRAGTGQAGQGRDARKSPAHAGGPWRFPRPFA